MMREMKCSYCKNNLAYVSRMQTIHEFDLMTYRCIYCGVITSTISPLSLNNLLVTLFELKCVYQLCRNSNY
jgi:hypothetical protein